MMAENLAMDIANQINYGECFYDEGCFNALLRDIDDLKELCIKEHKETQERMKDNK